MASCNDLYAMEPERVDDDFTHLKGHYYDHLPEAQIDDCMWSEFMSALYSAKSEKPVADRIKIKWLKDFCFDGRRVWQLATVWFDDKPIMVIQNAGREGDDHADRYVTDPERLLSLCVYVRELMAKYLPNEVDKEDIVSPDKEIPGLTDFYGNKLDGYFTKY